MRTLFVGVGALGGVVAARLRGSGAPVWLATRNAESAAALRASGLRVTGVGGALSVEVAEVAAVDEYGREAFDLIVLATKAQDAIDVAPRLSTLLGPGGTLLPIQNGDVAHTIADRLGDGRVLGGLSNFGATMTAPGVYEQRNAGHLLLGELAGGESERAEQVRRWLGRAVDVRLTPNFRGAVWSKLLLNCSVTTIGAVAGRTMREYVASPDGRELFDRTYDEALSVALASGARPERMLVDPTPPAWRGRSVPGEAHDAWLGQVLRSYGDVKPSMLQDFERGRPTEIDFVNGYVVDVGRRVGVRTPANAAIAETVHAITRGQLAPDPALLGRILQAVESGVGSRDQDVRSPEAR
jgi:2-dehydropantoate 2-reductase